MIGPTILFCLFLIGVTLMDLIFTIRSSNAPSTDPRVGGAFARFISALVFAVFSFAFILFLPETFSCQP